MIIARFFQGPADSKVLTLPEPWERFVIPEFGDIIDIEYFYLLAGEIDYNVFAYLYEHALD